MIFLIIGIILFLITATDIVYTVLSSNGAGYLSKYSVRYIAALFQFAARRLGSRRILRFAGVSTLAGMIIIWILLLWISVFLIFLYDPSSVVDSSKLNPASTVERFYFAGYLLSTLGNGDFKPQTGWWQIVANIFTFSGFVFLTTAITYFIRIIDAVTQKRLLAMTILDLGKSGEKIADSILKLQKGGQLMSEITKLKTLFNQHTLNHTSFPISHYFFSQQKHESVSVASAELHKALRILRENQNSDECLKTALETLNKAFDSYLQMLAERFLGNIPDKKIDIDNENIDNDKIRINIIRELLKSDLWLENHSY